MTQENESTRADGAPDDENPEWTEETMKKARRGAPWMWEAADALRDTAKTLRDEAETLEQKADKIDPPDLKKAG